MRTSNLFWGGILLLFGGLLLLNSLDIVRIDVWGLIWPLFLIMLGAAILWGTMGGRRPVEVEEFSLPLDGVSKAKVQFNHGAGRLTVSGGANQNELLSGRFGGGIDHRMTRSGDDMKVVLRVKSNVIPWFFTPWSVFSRGALDWDVRVNDEVPLELHFKSGANDANIDLTDAKITDLKLETGASSTVVHFPKQSGFTQARINAGAASIRILIPEDVAARILVSGGLMNTSVDQQRFPRVGGEYKSPDFESATNRLELKIDTGVGSVTVE